MRMSAESVPPRLVASSSFVTQQVVGRAGAKRARDSSIAPACAAADNTKLVSRSVARVGERFELVGRARIALAQAGAVDQYQATLAQTIEQLGQVRGAVDRVRGYAQQSTERVDLFLRADADAVGRHECDVACAVTQNPTSGELRDQRGLADAGRTDKRDDTAAFHPTFADGLDATCHQREREAVRFGQFHSLRQLTHELAGEIVRRPSTVN